MIAREAVAALHAIDQRLRAEAMAVGYIGPFRQTPDRYYRVQDLSVDAIDASGKNLPMVLRSLPPSDLADLSSWLRSGLGFGVEVGGDGPHVEVRVVEGHGITANLVDTGFGLSQVLPIAVQLWKAARSPGRRPLRTLVMEQPELHLHPELQSRLGRLFAGVASSYQDDGVRLLVETHSEPFLNAVGEAVALESIDRKLVSVVLFERDPASGISTTRVTEFDADGRLQDWPIGFFSA